MFGIDIKTFKFLLLMFKTESNSTRFIGKMTDFISSKFSPSLSLFIICDYIKVQLPLNLNKIRSIQNQSSKN